MRRTPAWRTLSARWPASSGWHSRCRRASSPASAACPGLEVFGRIHAAQRIGGDFYDVEMLDEDGRQIGLVIGDASGSGIPAVLVMVLGLIVMRESARQSRNPAEILDRVNRRIREHFPDRRWMVYHRHPMCWWICRPAWCAGQRRPRAAFPLAERGRGK